MRQSLGVLLLMVFLSSVSLGAGAARVLVLGDSIAEGLGVAPEEAFPALLQRSLAAQGHADVTVINAGVSGSTTASGVSRLQWQLRQKPDVLIVELGANDVLRGLPAAQAKKNLSELIELAQRNDVKVLLAGMKAPPNYGERYGREFQQIYPDLAKRYRIPLVPFFLEGVAGVRELNQGDGVHPTAAGHQKIARLILPYLLPLL